MVKFTEKLEANIRQPWAAHYIDYKGLQKVIKSLLASRPLDEPMSALAVPLLPEGEGPSQPQEGRFLRALRKEWQKVNAFYVEELQRQSEQLTLLLEQMRQGLEETGSGRETGSAMAIRKSYGKCVCECECITTGDGCGVCSDDEGTQSKGCLMKTGALMA